MCKCKQSKCIKKDPIVGSWTVSRTGGTPRDLTSQGTTTFNADGTCVFNFAAYLGVPTPNRSVSLVCPPSGTWKKIGCNRYKFFAQSVVAVPTADPDYPQLSLFPAGSVIRVTCESEVSISFDGKTLDSIPGTDVCNFYAASDLDLATPIAPPNTGETYHAVKVGIY